MMIRGLLRTLLFLPGLLLVVGVVAAACGGDGEGATAHTEEATATEERAEVTDEGSTEATEEPTAVPTEEPVVNVELNVRPDEPELSDECENG